MVSSLFVLLALPANYGIYASWLLRGFSLCATHLHGYLGFEFLIIPWTCPLVDPIISAMSVLLVHLLVRCCSNIQTGINSFLPYNISSGVNTLQKEVGTRKDHGLIKYMFGERLLMVVFTLGQYFLRPPVFFCDAGIFLKLSMITTFI